jgi:hypothetical protein
MTDAIFENLTIREYNPTVILDGLVLYLDIGNAASYSGSGDIIYDLATTRTAANSAIIGGSVGAFTYSGDNQGILYNDGTGTIIGEAYVNDDLAYPVNGNFTVEMWFKSTSSTSGYTQIFSIPWGSPGQDYYTIGLRIGDSGFGNKLQCALDFSSTATCYSTIYSRSDLLNLWTHVAMTRISNEVRLYINGVLQNLGTGADPSTFDYTYFTDGSGISGSTSLGYGFGCGSAGGSPLEGYVSNFKFYNGKGLTGLEVLYNYNIIKSRFGL